jgi:endonuclease/exonuclease/phosphatase family metal-dependent hydrolase
MPVLALDRLWVDPPEALTAVFSVRTLEARAASDHLPVVASFRF